MAGEKGRGRGPAKTTKRNIEAAERQAQALALRRDGYTFAMIALEVGFSHPSGAYKAVETALDRTVREPAEALRELELCRLDSYLDALSPKIKQGEPRSMGVALKISERRARLLGLDAPAKYQVTEVTIETEEQALAAISKEINSNPEFRAWAKAEIERAEANA